MWIPGRWRSSVIFKTNRFLKLRNIGFHFLAVILLSFFCLVVIDVDGHIQHEYRSFALEAVVPVEVRAFRSAFMQAGLKDVVYLQCHGKCFLEEHLFQREIGPDVSRTGTLGRGRRAVVDFIDLKPCIRCDLDGIVKTEVVIETGFGKGLFEDNRFRHFQRNGE